MRNLFKSHILLGKAKGSGAPVWYPKLDLTLHLLLLGKTGFGKTNFINWLVSQLLNDIAIWFFDRKEDFRHLLRFFPNKLLVIDIMKDLKCNPLVPPPYESPKKWLGRFCSMFCAVNGLLVGSRNLMYRVLNKLFCDYGVYNDSGIFPSFFELLEALKELKFSPSNRESHFRESLVNRFEAYLASNKDIYDCSLGYNIEKLINKSVVFEITGLLDEQADFWINYFLLWAFAYRIAKKERGNILRNVVVFDESQAVFSPFVNPAVGHSPISHMVSMVREFGIGIVAASQTAHLNNSIIANSQLKILLSLGSGQDLTKAQMSIGLRYDQAAYMYRLGRGEAIVRIPKIEEPFILQIPKFPLE